MQNIQMSDGYLIPVNAIGTFQIQNPTVLTNIIKQAYSLGQRHIDTASCYNNEQNIG